MTNRSSPASISTAPSSDHFDARNLSVRILSSQAAGMEHDFLIVDVVAKTPPAESQSVLTHALPYALQLLDRDASDCGCKDRFSMPQWLPQTAREDRCAAEPAS